MRISVLCVGVFCLTSPMALGADLKSDVQAAYEAFNEAFNKGDAAGVAAFYTEDAKLLPPTHDVLTGPAGAEQFFTALFEAGVTNHALEIIEVHGDGDLAYSAANWTPPSTAFSEEVAVARSPVGDKRDRRLPSAWVDGGRRAPGGRLRGQLSVGWRSSQSRRRML